MTDITLDNAGVRLAASVDGPERHDAAGLDVPEQLQDLDWGEGPIADPPSPPLSQAWGTVKEMFTRAGLNDRMGLSLQGALVAAGLPAPRMSLFAPAGGGADFDGYDYMASGLRSNLPHIVRLGVATEAELALDSFAERLRAEVVALNGVFALPTFVGAWSRKPPG